MRREPGLTAGVPPLMTMARAGVLVAVAGGIALPILAVVYARQKQQQSACEAWRRARADLANGAPALAARPASSQWVQRRVTAALDTDALSDARDLIARYPLAISALVPAVSDPTPVSARERIPHDFCWMSLEEGLWRRADRASWLLKQATGRQDAGEIPRQTDPIQLADLARDWRRWLDDLDGGRTCFPALR